MKRTILSIFTLILLISTQPTFSQWSAVGGSLGPTVKTLSFYSNELYAGGSFSSPSILGKLSGSAWVAMGSGFVSPVEVDALADYSGYLYVGGGFGGAGSLGSNSANIARWNGSWNYVGNGANGMVKCLAVINGSLYAGGQFTAVNNTGGQVSGTGCIAKWDGSTWTALGTGIGGTAAVVNSIVQMGTDIYAAGSFTTAGGNSIANIAKWNGSTWSSVGTLTATVNSLAVFGGSLYAGGSFGIKRWTGSAWLDLGSGVSGSVYAMTVYNGALTVGGNFSQAGGVGGTAKIARWNGTTWFAFNSTLTGDVWALHVMPTNSAVLYAGGAFTNGQNGPYAMVAKYTTLVGVEEESVPATDVAIYPNPAHYKFKINVTSALHTEKADLIIYNALGRQVKQLSILKNQALDINCNDLSAGIYMLKVIDGKKTYVQKVIIE